MKHNYTETFDKYRAQNSLFKIYPKDQFGQPRLKLITVAEAKKRGLIKKKSLT